MAQFEYKKEIQPFYQDPKNLIEQGDIVYCNAHSGAISFWGIYGHNIGIVSLDGGGNIYLPKDTALYLYGTYNHWTITKRIPNMKVKFTIEEI